MNGFLMRLLICLFFGAFCTYVYINDINETTMISLIIPEMEREVGNLLRENEQLRYEIDQFESPIHLMELSRRPEFGHLKHPLVKDVLHVSRGRIEKSD